MKLHPFALLYEGTYTVLGVCYHPFCWQCHLQCLVENRVRRNLDFRRLSQRFLWKLGKIKSVPPAVSTVNVERAASMTQSTRKILILGRPKSGKLSLVKALTSSLPSDLTHETTPHAGLTHSITLTTRYYSVEAGIWIDEIPDDAETWLKEYSSEEASPVLQSLAAIVLTIDPSTGNSEQYLQWLKKLNERGEEVEWDGACIVVGKKQGEIPVADMPSLCEDLAFEYVDLNASGENDHGGKIF
jgi:hypothetical protein